MADYWNWMSISSGSEGQVWASSSKLTSYHPYSPASTPPSTVNEYTALNTLSIFDSPHADTEKSSTFDRDDAAYSPGKSKGKRRASTLIDASPTASISASLRKKVRIASPPKITDAGAGTAVDAEEDLNRGASQDMEPKPKERFSPFAPYFHTPRVTRNNGKRRASTPPDWWHISAHKRLARRMGLLAMKNEPTEFTITPADSSQEDTVTEIMASPQRSFDLPRVTIPPDVLRAIFHPPSANSPRQSSSSTTTRKKPFNLLGHIMNHPELILCLVSWLPPEDLLSLYAISKPFHWLMNSHFTTYVKAILRRRAPHALDCFPFRWYRHLCIADPAWRLKTTAEARLAAQGLTQAQAQVRDIRMVPGIRYLKMAVNRHKVVADIITELRSRELRLPRGAFKAICKCWFVMDMARNGTRIAVLHNQQYWTKQDLFNASHFFMKFDMACADPVESTGERALSRLFLGLPTLACLRNLLRGDYCWWDILRFKVCYDYVPQPQHRHLPIFGIPPHFIGRYCMEGWGQGNSRLLRIDELVMRESIRRNIRMNQHYLNFMMYGFWMELDWLEKNHEIWAKFKEYKSWRANRLALQIEKMRLRGPIIEGMD